jgi:hypothetical protein
VGLSGWLKKLLKGNPEDNSFKKAIDAEAKLEEKKAYEEEYKISRMEAAKERGKLRAQKSVHSGGKGGGGIMDTLARIGAMTDNMSKGVVKDVDLNPDGANNNFDFSPQATEMPFRSEPFRQHSTSWHPPPRNRNRHRHHRNRRREEPEPEEEYRYPDPLDPRQYGAK